MTRSRLDKAFRDPKLNILGCDPEPRAELRCAELATLDRPIDGLAAEAADRCNFVRREQPTLKSVFHPTPRSFSEGRIRFANIAELCVFATFVLRDSVVMSPRA